MTLLEHTIHEAGLGSRRLRDLGLTIVGTPLEAVIARIPAGTRGSRRR